MTTPASKPIYAVIDPASPYARHWIDLLGTDCVEVESAEPITAIDADGGLGLFYRVKVASLSEYQIVRLISELAEFWDKGSAETLALIRGEHGVPIEAGDVVVGPDPVEARIHFAMRAAFPARTGPVTPHDRADPRA